MKVLTSMKTAYERPEILATIPTADVLIEAFGGSGSDDGTKSSEGEHEKDD